MARFPIEVAPEGTDPISSNIRMPRRRGNREWLTILVMGIAFVALMGWAAWTWMKPKAAEAVSPTVTAREVTETADTRFTATNSSAPVLTPILEKLDARPTPDANKFRRWGTWAGQWPDPPTPTLTPTTTLTPTVALSPTEEATQAIFLPPARDIPSITEPIYTPYPTYTLYPTQTPYVIIHPTYTPYPTPTGIPYTPTPTATCTPTPSPITLLGVIQRVGGCYVSNVAITTEGVNYWLLLGPDIQLPPSGDPSGWLALATGYTTLACNGLALQTTGLSWLASPTITPTPTETGTATSTPTATNTPLPTDTPTPTETGTATSTPTATNTPLPTDIPTPTETPMPTETLVPTVTLTATEVITP